MKLKYTILYVQDVGRTLDFYQRCFGLSVKMLHESGDYGEMQTGETVLAFAALDFIRSTGKHAKAADINAPNFEIAFETDDVAGAIDTAVAAGAGLVQSATQMPWGQTVGYVSDQDGFLVEICSAISG